MPGAAPAPSPAQGPVPGGTGQQHEPSPVRAAFSGLTTRGRSFLAAGLTAVACSYVLGQPALLRIGLLLAVLPPVAALLVARTRYRVASGRRLSPARAVAGTEARVHLRVDNVSRLTTGVLMLEDTVPYVLGPRPRFVLRRIESRGFREVSYRVRSDLRGRYPLGPLRLRLGDPFGLCTVTRAFTSADTLVVVPRVEPLPHLRLTGDGTGLGDGRTRAISLSGDDDVIPREYRHGDELRRVHWRSTAKYGELMVRREEQPVRSHATVLLDTRIDAHGGVGPASSFEWAVGAAASIGVHLLGQGLAVRLLTDTGASAGSGQQGGGGPESEAAGVLLDCLAVVEPSAGGGFTGAEAALRQGGEGLLVAVVGDVDGEALTQLPRLRRRAAQGVLVLLDVDAWEKGAAPTASGTTAQSGSAGSAATADGRLADEVRLLREAGWRVLIASPGTSVSQVWAGLRDLADGSSAGSSPGSGSGPAGAAAWSVTGSATGAGADDRSTAARRAAAAAAWGRGEDEGGGA